MAQVTIYTGQSPGFLHHIQRLIAQLKQGAVDPDTFREKVCRRGSPSVFDNVVTEIFTNYHQALRASASQAFYKVIELTYLESLG